VKKRSFVVVLALLTMLAIGCVTNTALKKAKVAQDIFISTLETTAKNMPAIEKQFPTKVKEVKKVYMQAKDAVQAYQTALEVWEATDAKPVNYEEVLTKAFDTIGQLRKLLTSMGVKL